MNPLQYKDLLINFTDEFVPLWNDKGSGAHKSVSFWRPAASADPLSQFFTLGDIAAEGYRNINQQKIAVVVSDANKVDGTALRPPVDFQLVWKDTGSRSRNDFSIWRPLPPEGYVAMGLVCGVDYDKPPLNTVRCIRADLVAVSQAGALIWNDKGSRASMDFAVWAVTPPCAEPGEINLAPGTFIGTDSYAKPSQQTPAYSLRLPLTAQMNTLPAPPQLSGYEPPAPMETVPSPQVCQLPWFTINDPELSTNEQLHNCPVYRLERTDHYQFVGFGHNTSDANEPFMWTATKGETGEQSKALAATSGVELCDDWPRQMPGFELSFCAQLTRDFTHCQRSAKGWGHSSSLEIITYVPAKKAVAAYVIKSEYRLLRQDGSQVTGTVSYTNGDQVYLSEYPVSAPAPAPADSNELQPAAPQAEPVPETIPPDINSNSLVP